MTSVPGTTSPSPKLSDPSGRSPRGRPFGVPWLGMAVVEGPFVKPRDQQLSRHSWRGEAPEAGTSGPWDRGELCWWARVRLDTGDGEEVKIFSAHSPEAAMTAARAWIAGHPRASAPPLAAARAEQ